MWQPQKSKIGHKSPGFRDMGGTSGNPIFRGRRAFKCLPTLIVGLLIGPGSLFAQRKTTVADTLFGLDGTPLNGYLIVKTATAFTSPDGFAVAAGTQTRVNVSNGAFSVQLIPNVGASPAGSSYQVQYFVAAQNVTEVWIIPQTPNPAKLADVRAVALPLPITQLPIAQVTPPSSCTSSQFLKWMGTGWGCGQGGTVASVQLAMPPEFTVTGSPVTSSGTMAVTKTAQLPNLVFAGPSSGSAEKPAFRSLVAADLPANIAQTGACPANSFVTMVNAGAPTCASPAPATLDQLTDPAGGRIFNLGGNTVGFIGGNLAIGTDTPASPLTVNGNATFQAGLLESGREPLNYKLGDNGAWQVGIDGAALIPFRDFAICLNQGTVSQYYGCKDLFYINHNAPTSALASAALAGATTLNLTAPLTLGPLYNVVEIGSNAAANQEVVTVTAGSGTSAFTVSPLIHSHAARTVTDAVLNGTTTLTSSTAHFTAADLYMQVGGAGIPTPTNISAVNSPTSITLSRPATTSASGVSATFSELVSVVGDPTHSPSFGIGGDTANDNMRVNIFGEPTYQPDMGELELWKAFGQTADIMDIGYGNQTDYRIASDFSHTMYSSAANRVVTDGVLNGTATVTSATANFTSADLGRFLAGTGIPAGSYIMAVISPTNVTISNSATQTATGVALTVNVPLFAVNNLGFAPWFQVLPAGGGGAVIAPVQVFGIGAGMSATPGANLDIATPGTNTATLLLRTGNQGALKIAASGTPPANVAIGANNASALALQSNGNCLPLPCNKDGVYVDLAQNVALGSTTITTSSTGGFPYIPAAAGPPTGVPAAQSGFVPMYYDTANHKLWIYDGDWKGVALN